MKNSTNTFLILLAIMLFSCGNGQKKEEKRAMVLISTRFGDMKVALYNETPNHRDNFLKLVKSGYYDSLLFHRVINEFMLQGGDPESRNAAPDQRLGNGGPGYTLENEIMPGLFHKKGALAAARLGDQVNPEKKSSGSQFYIVQGVVFPPNELPALEEKENQKRIQSYIRTLAMNNKDSISFYQQTANQVAFAILMERLQNEAIAKVQKDPFHLNEEQKQLYTTIGGVPHLDGGYTVFGEVTEGLSVIDSIAVQPTDSYDRPLKDIKMKITILKE